MDSPRKLFNTSTLVQMERGNNSDVFQSVDPVSTTIFCFFGAALFCTVLKRLRIVRLENFFLCSALMLTQKGKGAGGSQWTAGILSFDNILSYVIWKFKRFPLPPSTRQPHGSFRPTGLPGFRGSIRLKLIGPIHGDNSLFDGVILGSAKGIRPGAGHDARLIGPAHAVLGPVGDGVGEGQAFRCG